MLMCARTLHIFMLLFCFFLSFCAEKIYKQKQRFHSRPHPDVDVYLFFFIMSRFRQKKKSENKNIYTHFTAAINPDTRQERVRESKWELEVRGGVHRTARAWIRKKCGKRLRCSSIDTECCEGWWRTACYGQVRCFTTNVIHHPCQQTRPVVQWLFQLHLHFYPFSRLHGAANIRGTKLSRLRLVESFKVSISLQWMPEKCASWILCYMHNVLLLFFPSLFIVFW